MHGGVRNMRGGKKMIYKNISFKAAPFSYELFFDDRITLVGGDSGTGKTVLYEILAVSYTHLTLPTKRIV